MSEEIKQILESNPTWTYGMAIGYAIGRAAKLRGNQFESLSEMDWRNETTDYAHGYRRAFQDRISADFDRAFERITNGI